MIHFIGDPSLVANTEIKHATVKDLVAWVSTKDIVGVDTETEGLFDFQNKVIMLQIGDLDDQFVIDTRVTDISDLKPFFESSTLKLFWNAKFDVNFLRFTFGFEVTNVADCFLAECLLNAGRKDVRMSLEAAAMKYCNKKLDKAQRSKFVGLLGRPFTYHQIKYGAEDVALLPIIHELQEAEIYEEGLGTVLKLENAAVMAIADIEYNGMALDRTSWISLANITERNRDESIKRLDDIVLRDPRLARFVPAGIQTNLFGFEERRIKLNWSSPADKVAVLQSLGINLTTSNANELLPFRHEPLVAELLEYSKQNKLADAFGRAFLGYVNPVTTRVHQNIWQVLATGRMASREPNLTQIPSKGALGKAIRACFVASPGTKFVGGDFSGCELRIIAEGSQDPVWLEAFRNGEDLHSKLASIVFDVPIGDVTKPTPFKPDITYREVQKTINFGLAYGMSEFKLAKTIDVEVPVALNIINKFFKAVPKVKAYLDRLGSTAVAYYKARSLAPFYRIRYFDQPQDSYTSFKLLGEIERAGKNHPIQGSNADLTKTALVLIRNHINANNLPIKIVNVIHDEIITECAEEYAEEWRPVMEELMIKAAKFVIRSIPVKVDCKISDKWEK